MTVQDLIDKLATYPKDAPVGLRYNDYEAIDLMVKVDGEYQPIAVEGDD